jgi:hypothetical protein
LEQLNHMQRWRGPGSSAPTVGPVPVALFSPARVNRSRSRKHPHDFQIQWSH